MSLPLNRLLPHEYGTWPQGKPFRHVANAITNGGVYGGDAMVLGAEHSSTMERWITVASVFSG